MERGCVYLNLGGLTGTLIDIELTIQLFLIYMNGWDIELTI